MMNHKVLKLFMNILTSWKEQGCAIPITKGQQCYDLDLFDK